MKNLFENRCPHIYFTIKESIDSSEKSKMYSSFRKKTLKRKEQNSNDRFHTYHHGFPSPNTEGTKEKQKSEKNHKSSYLIYKTKQKQIKTQKGNSFCSLPTSLRQKLNLRKQARDRISYKKISDLQFVLPGRSLTSENHGRSESIRADVKNDVRTERIEKIERVEKEENREKKKGFVLNSKKRRIPFIRKIELEKEEKWSPWLQDGKEQCIELSIWDRKQFQYQ